MAEKLKEDPFYQKLSKNQQKKKLSNKAKKHYKKQKIESGQLIKKPKNRKPVEKDAFKTQALSENKLRIVIDNQYCNINCGRVIYR